MCANAQLFATAARDESAIELQCTSDLESMTQVALSSSQQLANGLRHFVSFDETVAAGVTSRSTEVRGVCFSLRLASLRR